MSNLPIARQISIEQAIEITESAFLPLKCVVNYSDFDDTFDFAVYLPDGERRVYKESATSIQNAPKLQRVLEEAKKSYAFSGVSFNLWTFPDD
jgi:hypothetical protein